MADADCEEIPASQFYYLQIHLLIVSQNYPSKLNKDCNIKKLINVQCQTFTSFTLNFSDFKAFLNILISNLLYESAKQYISESIK